MRTVKEVSDLTGVSIRALHHYDAIDLLRPTQITESGYRLYDDRAMERLQMILLFKELKFPLKEIKEVLDSPAFDRGKALDQQIELLTLQKEHIQNLIDLARGIRMLGVKRLLDFQAFDTRKIDEYAREAKASWGKTEAYREFEEKAKLRSPGEEQRLSEEMMDIFRQFGALQGEGAQSAKVQALVKKLRDFITENFYQCTPEILRCLGKMYAGDGRFTVSIDEVGGEGTARFAEQAIEVYCEAVVKSR